VAATNRDLAYAVASGAFRQDLYYRLKVMELHLPSLRERQRDILPLARRLIDEAAAKMKRTVSDLGPAAADRLLGYPWPGNVRELENTMERAVALARGPRVELEDLPEEVREAVPQSLLPRGAGRTLADVKKQHVLSVLFLNGGNRARTAAQLKIGPATLYRRLKTYGVTSGVGGAQKTVLVRAPV
jgi:DNA-binding NtrC family response regulator